MIDNQALAGGLSLLNWRLQRVHFNVCVFGGEPLFDRGWAGIARFPLRRDRN